MIKSNLGSVKKLILKMRTRAEVVEEGAKVIVELLY